MLILNELGQLLWIHLAEIVKDAQIGFERLVQTRNQLPRHLFAVGLNQHLLRIVDAAAHQQLLRRNELVIFR